MASERTQSSTDKAVKQSTTERPEQQSLKEARLPNVARQARIDPRMLTPNGILQLQRTIGNQAVQKILNNAGSDASIQRAIDRNLTADVALQGIIDQFNVLASTPAMTQQIKDQALRFAFQIVRLAQQQHNAALEQDAAAEHRRVEQLPIAPRRAPART